MKEEGEAQVLQIHKLLLEAYGHHIWERRLSPLEELIFTILSQNTSDTNRDRAEESLKARYSTWEEVLAAPEAELAEVIGVAGLGNIRAARIKAVLGQVLRERGGFDLEFLAEMGMEEARSWLEAMPGVGPKTSACVLLFSLGRPALPVDTHIHRVAKRLGLLEEKTSREEAHRILEAMVPAEAVYDFHLNMIAHGRAVCQARRPKCEICMLQELCRYYQEISGRRTE